jgi:hypothetical protein
MGYGVLEKEENKIFCYKKLKIRHLMNFDVLNGREWFKM